MTHNARRGRGQGRRQGPSKNGGATNNFFNAKIYGIDTWKGDKQAGFYNENVFAVVKKIKDTIYKNVNIILVRKFFENRHLMALLLTRKQTINDIITYQKTDN